MNRWSLHGAYVGATLIALSAAVSVEPARAHLDVRPRLAVQGAVTDVVVELPQLRPGGPPSRLELRGAGIELISSELAATVGAETRWTVRLRVTADPGLAPLVLRAVYADGRSVEIDQQLTVLPAPETSGFPWTGVVAGVLLAVAIAGFSFRLARRKA